MPSQHDLIKLSVASIDEKINAPRNRWPYRDLIPVSEVDHDRAKQVAEKHFQMMKVQSWDPKRKSRALKNMERRQPLPPVII